MMKFNRFVLAASILLAAGTCGMASTSAAARDDDHESARAGSHERERSSDGDHTGLVPGVSVPVTLSNQSNESLEVDIRFQGNDPRDFTQTNNCGEKLMGQSSCVINVTFAPLASGARSATMEIHTSGGTKYVYLTGTGI